MSESSAMVEKKQRKTTTSLKRLTLDGKGKCEGKKSYQETNPELIRITKKGEALIT